MNRLETFAERRLKINPEVRFGLDRDGLFAEIPGRSAVHCIAFATLKLVRPLLFGATVAEAVRTSYEEAPEDWEGGPKTMLAMIQQLCELGVLEETDAVSTHAEVTSSEPGRARAPSRPSDVVRPVRGVELLEKTGPERRTCIARDGVIEGDFASEDFDGFARLLATIARAPATGVPAEEVARELGVAVDDVTAPLEELAARRWIDLGNPPGPWTIDARDLDEATLARAGETFAADGVLVIKNAFDPETLRRAAAAIFEAFAPEGASAPPTSAVMQPTYAGRYAVALDFAKPFDEPHLYANAACMKVLERLLDPGFVLQAYGAVIAYPGAPQQHIHADCDIGYGGVSAPAVGVTLAIPCGDWPKEAGGTRFWLGSHRNNTDLSPERAFDLKPPLGSCYVFDRRITHRGLPNGADRPRPLLHLVYARPWHFDHINFYRRAPLTVTREKLDGVPREHRHLFLAADIAHKWVESLAGASGARAWAE